MQWWVVIPLAYLTVCATPVAADPDTPDECKVPDSELSATEEKLCGEIRERNQKIKSLNQTQNEDYWKSIDAWNPEKEEPAIWIVRNRDPDAEDPADKYGVFQYVGEGFGTLDLDNDGVKSWKRVPIETKGEPGFGVIKVSPYYTPAGVNATFEVPQSEAESELRQRGEQFNTPAGFASWQRWRASNEKEKGTVKTSIQAIYVAFLPVLSFLSVYAEAKTGKLRGIFQEMEKIQRRYDGTDSEISRWQALKEVIFG